VAATIGSEIAGTPTLFSVAFDLATVGYSVHEHFATGTATSYVDVSPRGPDGRWDVEPSTDADYATRLVIYTPTDPARANGTLVVEWLNVTGGLDVPALWMASHRHLLRSGYTWVGVSTQAVGLEGGGVLPGLGLHHTAPERYGALHLPGDAYAFDVFTQIARTLRELVPAQYGVPVDRVLATGASQSAMYLTTYINAVDPGAETIDGFLLQGRSGAAPPMEGWNLGRIDPTRAADAAARRARLAGRDQIRDDVRVPVMVVQSETDVFGTLAYLPARQPDGERFRLWEVAGASHCDTYFLCASAHDSGALPAQELAELIGRADRSGVPTELPINSGPQMHYVLQRAFDALDTWVRDGHAPPPAPRLDVTDDGDLARDADGIARGGLRTPWVDAPVTVVSGLGQPGELTELFGTTKPLDDTALATRYPRGREDYAECFRAATAAAAASGVLVEADVPEIDALGALAWPS
jgi:hypothetical protein